MLTEDGKLNWQEVMTRLRQWVRPRVHDSADVDELVQDILERLIANQESLAAADNPVGWVHRVTTNTIIDYYRRSKRQVALEALPWAETSSDGEEARAALSDCLRPLVMHLDSHSREALLRTDLGGKSQIDAAQEVGIPISTMKARIQRSRRKLRHLLLQCCHVALDGRQRVIDFAPRSPPGAGQGACCHAGCAPAPTRPAD